MSEPNRPSGSNDPDTAPLPAVPPRGTAVMPGVHGELPHTPQYQQRPSATARSLYPGDAGYPATPGYQPEPKVSARAGGARRYLLPALALALVAVLSGVLWWLVNRPSQDGASAVPAGSSVPAGEYHFSRAHSTVLDTDCVAHSYGKTQRFLTKHHCQRLTRTLYTTTVNGVEVFSSVSVVRMPDAGVAAQLKALTDSNNTGNVTDLVKDGVTAPGAPQELAGGGYASSRNGRLVTIVESKAERGRKLSDQVLTGVSRDALRFGRS